MRAYLFCCLTICGFGDWIDERVAQELADFPKKSVKRSSIAAAALGGQGLSLYAEAAHIVIEGGVARVEAFLTTGNWNAKCKLRRFIRDINAWQKSAHTRPSRKLPDTEFLLSFSDGIESKRQIGYVNTSCYGVPVFTFAKLKNSSRLVLFPDSRAIFPWRKIRREVARDVARGSARFHWSSKREVAFWQGLGSDGVYSKESWRSLGRGKLVCFSRENPSLVHANFTGPLQYCNRATLDEVLNTVGPQVGPSSPADFLSYKYLIDLEGASLDWYETFGALLSNSALFKQKSDFIQWYSSELKPWEHYIPVENDLSDLEKQIIWAKGNDDKVHEIAKASTKLASELFDRRVTFDYIKRLLLAYNERLVP